jgi:hypothetical protein
MLQHMHETDLVGATARKGIGNALKVLDQIYGWQRHAVDSKGPRCFAPSAAQIEDHGVPGRASRGNVRLEDLQLECDRGYHRGRLPFFQHVRA